MAAQSVWQAQPFYCLAFPDCTQPPPTQRPRERGGLRNAARTVRHTRALLGLALALIVRGILSDGHLQFGNIYLEQLGAATSTIGIASMLQAAVELPCMFLADRVVRRGPARHGPCCFRS